MQRLAKRSTPEECGNSNNERVGKRETLAHQRLQPGTVPYDWQGTVSPLLLSNPQLRFFYENRKSNSEIHTEPERTSDS